MTKRSAATSENPKGMVARISRAARERLKASGVWEIEEEAEREVRERARSNRS